MLDMNQKIYRLASDFDEQAGKTPGEMIVDLRKNSFTLPFREFVYGYEGYNTTLDQLLKVKQFDGQIQVTTSPVSSDGLFQITVELKNTGYMPWIKEAGHEIRLKGDASAVGLSGLTDLIEAPVVFGDKHEIILKGIAPAGHGSARIVVDFTSSFRRRQPIVSKTIELKW